MRLIRPEGRRRLTWKIFEGRKALFFGLIVWVQLASKTQYRIKIEFSRQRRVIYYLTHGSQQSISSVNKPRGEVVVGEIEVWRTQNDI